MKSNAEMVAASKSKRLDVGEIPKVKHAKIRAKCEKSLLEYARTYCCGLGGFFEFPPPKDAPRVVECFDALQRAFESSGTARPFHIRIGRGEGKTSDMKAAIEWALLTKKKKFVVSVSANAALAASIIEDIWNHLGQSPELLDDFPEWAHPIQFLNGNTRVAPFITHKKKTLGVKKTTDEFRLPKYEGDDDSGGMVRAVGFGSAVRGMNKGNLRPDLLLLDDIQTDEMATSAEQIEKARRLIDHGYMKLGGRKRITALMTSTTIQPEDLSESYAHNHYWDTVTFPKVIKWPTCWKTDDDPWQKYFDLRREDRVTGKDTAREFYRANRKAMDAGSEIFNPHYFNEQAEDSALQRAMNEWQDLGEEVFMAECQMAPIRASTVYDLTPDIVMNTANGVEAMVVPLMCSRRVLATVDVMNDAGLRWALTAFGESREAAVIAYGRYPSNGKLYGKNATLDEQDAAIASALSALLDDFSLGLFKVNGRPDIQPMRVGAVAIDAGWKTRCVLGVAEAKKRRFDGGVFTMRGVSWDKFVSRNAAGRLRNGVRSDDEWMMETKSKWGGTILGFHADYWRETAQRAWFVPPLQPGSLSVFGSREKHTEFANECVADHLVSKDKLRSGEATWKWSCRGANHLGDCVTMAFALAYWKRDFMTYAQRDDAVVAKDDSSQKRPFLPRRVVPLM